MSSIAWFRLASPASFFPLARRLVPWFSTGAALLAVALYIRIRRPRHDG